MQEQINQVAGASTPVPPCTNVPTINPHLKQRIASLSVRLAGSNDPCEDRYAIRSRGNVQAFGVFDGHGGFLAADIACSRLLDILLQHVDALAPQDRTPTNITHILDKTFQETDDIILEEAIRIHRRRDDIARVASSEEGSQGRGYGTGAPPMKPTGRAGSCALVMLIVDGTMYFAHSGDCRAAICASAKPVSPYRSNVAQDAQNASLAKVSETTLQSDAENLQDSFTLVDLFLEHSAAAQLAKEKEQGLENNGNGNGSGTALTRKNATATKRKREEGGYYFNARGPSMVLHGVTIDHTCNVAAEAVAIACMSDDSMPIRQSVVGRPRVPSQAPLRVGGSLVVTRALGDGYLKLKELSVEPFASHCPYITCRPTISYRKIQPTDRAIILASDGLWNFVSAKDCVNALSTVGRGVDCQNSEVRCAISTGCSYDSHVSTELSLHGDAGFVLNPTDVYSALSATVTTDTEVDTSSQIVTHPNQQAASSESEMKQNVDSINGERADENIGSEPSTPSATETASAVLILPEAECATVEQVAKQQHRISPEQGSKGGAMQLLNMDAAEQLLEVCLRSAAYYAKTNVDVLRSMEAGNSRRELVDDITVMVLYL